jgi:hypothetical protein
MKLFNWWRDHMTSRFRLDRERRKIVLDDTGFKIVENGEVKYWLTWANIRRIDAYKGSLITADLICLAFEYDDEVFCEVTERMEGFAALVARLPYLFKGLDADWPAKVAHAALATNRTEVWRRT